MDSSYLTGGNQVIGSIDQRVKESIKSECRDATGIVMDDPVAEGNVLDSVI